MTNTPPEGEATIAPPPIPVPSPLRRKVLRVNPEVLIGLGKRDGIRTVGAPVPIDARVIHSSVDERGDIVLLVESAEYPETVPGHRYPNHDPITFKVDE